MCVWEARFVLPTHVSAFVCLFAFFFFKPWLLTLGCEQYTLVGPVHCSQDPQTSFFRNLFIKNGFHGTIHTFKNYFVRVFSVFNCIQMDPECNKLFSECNIFSGENFFGKEKEEQNNGVNCASLACLYY